MAVENEGGNIPRGELSMDPMGSRSTSSASGRGGLNVDRAQLNSVRDAIRNIGTEARNATREVSNLVRSLGGLSGGGGGRLMGGGGGSRISVPMAGSANSPAAAARGIPSGGIPGGPPSGGGGPSGGGITGGGGGGTPTKTDIAVKTLTDANNYANARIAQGAEYSLQADRMTVQLQQMYGMSNAQVRNQLRMPLTTHYLLGGGAAINDLLSMQAKTGLTASTQASTVEALRTVSGFSLGSGDVTKMLSTMASPDVANRMFMMGGTGMYGLGGKERTGMQTIQDIVRRTGLTNPEALKGALQQGSNTRQRLTAMGVPQEMQDMVIQYAMQNIQYQKKTGGKGMYDPSQEADRKTMGIEGTYAVQHEKTTGERLKREERFYSRQTDNFADFEKNLRTATKALAAFEDRMSGIIGTKISIKGHPITEFVGKAIDFLNPFGDPIDSMKQSRSGDADPGSSAGATATPASSSSPKRRLKASDEAKLGRLDPRLSSALRPMLEENPSLYIGDTIRSKETQESEFRRRYQPTNKTKKTNRSDREWNGVIWEMKPEAIAANKVAMAPPGQSMHEIGLAADIQGDDNWIKNNAARFGLLTGYTGTGGPDDEPFHVEPKSASVLKGGANWGKSVSEIKSSAGKGGGSASFASTTIPGGGSSSGKPSTTMALNARLQARASASTGKGSSSTPSMLSSDAGAIAAQLTQQSNEKYNSLTAPSVSYGGRSGDPVVDGSMSSVGVSGGGGGMSITISPTIYLNGGSGMSTDMRKIAQEVGKLLEDEVKLRLMRRT